MTYDREGPRIILQWRVHARSLNMPHANNRSRGMRDSHAMRLHDFDQLLVTRIRARKISLHMFRCTTDGVCVGVYAVKLCTLDGAGDTEAMACENGSTLSGTTGACTCACAPMFEGTYCEIGDAFLGVFRSDVGRGPP